MFGLVRALLSQDFVTVRRQCGRGNHPLLLVAATSTVPSSFLAAVAANAAVLKYPWPVGHGNDGLVAESVCLATATFYVVAVLESTERFNVAVVIVGECLHLAVRREITVA